MIAVKNAEDLLSRTRQGAGRMVVAAADELEVLEGVRAARERHIVEPVLTGDPEKLARMAREIGMNLDGIEIIPAATPAEAVEKSMALVAEGKVQVCMKGLVNTAVFLKSVLDKRYGLRKNALLSHVALFFPEAYHKPLLVTDAALNVRPDFDDKLAILRNAVEVMHRLDVETPKVALLVHNEMATEKVPASIEFGRIRDLNREGGFPGCIVDGPLALDVALSAEAAVRKGVESPVSGDADILFCPEIVSANILYKSIVFLGRAHGAAVVTGASVPLVVTSRSEDARSKLLSIALAAGL